MNFEKQKLILEYLLSSNDLYARCSNIIKSEFFDVELRQVVNYTSEYYDKYRVLPKLDRIKAEYDLDFNLKTLDKTDLTYISDECERFAKHCGVREAIKNCMKDIAEDNYDNVVKRVQDAVMVSLDRDVGVDLYDNPQLRLEEAAVAIQLIPTGIKTLDDKLGGLARQQLTLFSANSGVGKSVVMSNIGDNLAASGLHVVYISLELNQNMVITRLAAIASGEDITTWKENIPKIASKINAIKDAGAGSHVVKRLKNGSNANDIRAFLKQYELVYGRKPDALVVDYVDIMSPIGGIGTMSVSEQDKAKSEQLYEIGVDYDCILLSASQQNRDGIKQTSPDQAVIAGGFSKINIVDNYISIYMTPQMRLEGVMLLYFLKTRSSSAVGDNIPVKFNRDNLQVTDIGDEKKIRAAISRLSSESSTSAPKHGKQPEKKEDRKPVGPVVMEADIPGLPGVEVEIKDESDEHELFGLMSFLTK
jgi:replicative DNA helicase